METLFITDTMKVEINDKNRERFFGQYPDFNYFMGTESLNNGYNHLQGLPCKAVKIMREYLELTPLLLITDEDAIEVAKITMRRHNRHYEEKDIMYQVIHRNSPDQTPSVTVAVLVNNSQRFRVEITEKDICISDIPKTCGNNTNWGNDYFAPNQFEVYQYLISKGIAASWMGLSVEEMIEAGWIKLKGANHE